VIGRGGERWEGRENRRGREGRKGTWIFVQKPPEFLVKPLYVGLSFSFLAHAS